MAPFNPQDRKRLLTKAFYELSENEKWRWHAYQRCWRKHVLGKSSEHPFDLKNEWADKDFDREAERVWREENPEDRSYRLLGPKPAEHVVRPDWPLIRKSDLTEAEYALFVEANARVLAEHRVDPERAQFRRMPR